MASATAACPVRNPLRPARPVSFAAREGSAQTACPVQSAARLKHRCPHPIEPGALPVQRATSAPEVYALAAATAQSPTQTGASAYPALLDSPGWMESAQNAMSGLLQMQTSPPVCSWHVRCGSTSTCQPPLAFNVQTGLKLDRVDTSVSPARRHRLASAACATSAKVARCHQLHSRQAGVAQAHGMGQRRTGHWVPLSTRPPPGLILRSRCTVEPAHLGLLELTDDAFDAFRAPRQILHGALVSDAAQVQLAPPDTPACNVSPATASV